MAASAAAPSIWQLGNYRDFQPLNSVGAVMLGSLVFSAACHLRCRKLGSSDHVTCASFSLSSLALGRQLGAKLQQNFNMRIAPTTQIKQNFADNIVKVFASRFEQPLQI